MLQQVKIFGGKTFHGKTTSHGAPEKNWTKRNKILTFRCEDIYKIQRSHDLRNPYVILEALYPTHLNITSLLNMIPDPLSATQYPAKTETLMVFVSPRSCRLVARPNASGHLHHRLTKSSSFPRHEWQCRNFQHHHHHSSSSSSH